MRRGRGSLRISAGKDDDCFKACAEGGGKRQSLCLCCFSCIEEDLAQMDCALQNVTHNSSCQLNQTVSRKQPVKEKDLLFSDL